MAYKPEITVGNCQFTNLVYADDTTLLVKSPTAVAICLSSLGEAASALVCVSLGQRQGYRTLGPWSAYLLAKDKAIERWGGYTVIHQHHCRRQSGGTCEKFRVPGQCSVFRWSVPVRCQETHRSCILCDGLAKEDIT